MYQVLNEQVHIIFQDILVKVASEDFLGFFKTVQSSQTLVHEVHNLLYVRVQFPVWDIYLSMYTSHPG